MGLPIILIQSTGVEDLLLEAPESCIHPTAENPLQGSRAEQDYLSSLEGVASYLFRSDHLCSKKYLMSLGGCEP